MMKSLLNTVITSLVIILIGLVRIGSVSSQIANVGGGVLQGSIVGRVSSLENTAPGYNYTYLHLTDVDSINIENTGFANNGIEDIDAYTPLVQMYLAQDKQSDGLVKGTVMLDKGFPYEIKSGDIYIQRAKGCGGMYCALSSVYAIYTPSGLLKYIGLSNRGLYTVGVRYQGVEYLPHSVNMKKCKNETCSSVGCEAECLMDVVISIDGNLIAMSNDDEYHVPGNGNIKTLYRQKIDVFLDTFLDDPVFVDMFGVVQFDDIYLVESDVVAGKKNKEITNLENKMSQFRKDKISKVGTSAVLPRVNDLNPVWPWGAIDYSFVIKTHEVVTSEGMMGKIFGSVRKTISNGIQQAYTLFANWLNKLIEDI